MDFGLSEEQRLLGETLRRFLDEHLPITRVREIAALDQGSDAEVWRRFAALGFAGCLIEERHGGSEQTLLDAAVIATALGNACAPLPFLGSAVLAPLLLRELASPAQQEDWLSKLAAGALCMGVAVAEQVERRQDAGVSLDNGTLRGTALFAIDAAPADVFLVAANRSLVLVSADAQGLVTKPLPTIDRTRWLAELDFDGVACERLGAQDDAAPALERAIDAARVILAADVLGSCDRALAMSVDYARDRQQFGRAIATFQAVKHLCAEMAAALEPARALVWYAAHAFDALPEEFPLSATLCKAHLAEVGHDLVRTATQVHGGIGFTDEYDLQLWFKRVGLDRQLLGGPERLRAHAAALQGLV